MNTVPMASAPSASARRLSRPVAPVSASALLGATALLPPPDESVVVTTTAPPLDDVSLTLGVGVGVAESLGVDVAESLGVGVEESLGVGAVVHETVAESSAASGPIPM